MMSSSFLFASRWDFTSNPPITLNRVPMGVNAVDEDGAIKKSKMPTARMTIHIQKKIHTK